MALNTNLFIEGINPTATFGGYASVLLQLIRQAYPSSTYGMILFDTTAPNVLGSNSWRKTCIWLDLTLPDYPTLNVYKEGTSPGWSNVNDVISNNSIKTSMIANYDPATPNTGVTLPKLATIGGTALQLIRVNATATAFEFVSSVNVFTVGSILPSAINATAIPNGYYLRVVGGVSAWSSSGITTKFVTVLATLGLVPTTVGFPVVLPHSLGQVPVSFRVSLICVNILGSIGYIYQEEVDCMSITQTLGTANNTAFTFQPTSVGVKVSNNSGVTFPIYIANGTTGVMSVVIPADWRLRLYATYTS